LTSGLFQDFYQTEYLSNYTSSAIAWIGAVNAFFLVVTGVIAGPLFDRGFLRFLMTLGCFMSVFGTMMLSLSTEYYQIFLSQGVCMGIGNGLVYVPALSMLSRLFAEQRAYAVGTTTTGASIGKSSRACTISMAPDRNFSLNQEASFFRSSSFDFNRPSASHGQSASLDSCSFSVSLWLCQSYGSCRSRLQARLASSSIGMPLSSRLSQPTSSLDSWSLWRILCHWCTFHLTLFKS
jgi:hypothetical protein